VSIFDIFGSKNWLSAYTLGIHGYFSTVLPILNKRGW